MVGGDQFAMPAQHRLRAHQQPDLVQHGPGEWVQWRGEEGPVSRSEPHPRTANLPFEDRELVPQGQDLHVLGPVTHRQQPQHRQPVRHGSDTPIETAQHRILADT
jgi:hypothetical protein